MRKFKVNWQTIILLVLFCLAIALRIFLAYENWPLTNSDEGTMGIIGMHIQQGAHPVIYYGQDYMGVLQAYLGSIFFTLFGRSVFTLRLGMVVLFAGFLLSMYILARQLYTRRFALFIVAIFTFGSSAMLTRQLMAIGGYPETILFSTFSLALALRLALTNADGEQWRASRYALFFLWGTAIALGAWSDSLIFPWAACSGLLLLFSWRELIFKAAVVAVIAGLLVGGIPLIIYNINAPLHHDTISVLIGQMGHVPLTLHTLKVQFLHTFTISLPTLAGSPTCYLSEYPSLQYWGFGNFAHSYCMTTNGIWSAIFCVLAAAATVMACWALGKRFLPLRIHTLSPEERRVLIINSARLILILGILGTILPYLRSGAALGGPGVNSRYLIGIWVGIPALIWPLWSGASYYYTRATAMRPISHLGKLGTAFCISSLAIILFISIYGSYRTLGQIPAAQASARTEQQFIQKLQSHNITHLYADYWVCYRLNFETSASVTCASFGYDTQNSTFIYPQNRYKPYLTTVQNDPYAPYLVNRTNKGMQDVLEKKLTDEHWSYQKYNLNDTLVIIQPIQHK